MSETNFSEFFYAELVFSVSENVMVLSLKRRTLETGEHAQMTELIKDCMQQSQLYLMRRI